MCLAPITTSLVRPCHLRPNDECARSRQAMLPTRIPLLCFRFSCACVHMLLLTPPTSWLAAIHHQFSKDPTRSIRQVFVTIVIVGSKLLGLNNTKKARPGPARKPEQPLQRSSGQRKDAKGSLKSKAVAASAPGTVPFRVWSSVGAVRGREEGASWNSSEVALYPVLTRIRVLCAPV